MKSKFKQTYKDILLEMSLPKGFSSFDVMDLDEFIDEEERTGNVVDINPKAKFESTIGIYVKEEIDDADIQDIDVKGLMKQRLGPISKDLPIAQRPEKMLHKNNIIDENGNIINPAKLKRMITRRPTSILSHNSKMKASGKSSGQVFFDLSLPSYQGLFVDENTGEFKVVRTCPAAGECSKFCYAAKGGYVMFPPSSASAARAVNFLMNDPEGFKNQLINEIQTKEKTAARNNKTIVIRWHDSGDFISEKYLQLAFDVAKQTPNVLHYAYTKQVPMVNKLEAQKPDNFMFTFSFGGEYDEEIDPLVNRHAQVVPYDLFKDLPKKKTSDGILFPPTSLKALKQNVAKLFKIRPSSIISYDELLQTPMKKNKRWNVLVWKGHGDDAATRKDVLGVYLLYH